METPANVQKPVAGQPWSEQIPTHWIMAAKKGCSQCHGRIKLPPKGPPFSQGPHAGRYLCMDCWTLVWNLDPQGLADPDTRKYIAGEAARIELRRKASILFQEGDIKVYKSSRGTFVLDILDKPELAANEFTQDRLAVLLRAINAVTGAKPVPQPVPVG